MQRPEALDEANVMEFPRISVLLAFVFVLAAVPAPGAPKGDAVVVNKGDSGKAVSVPKGGILEVRLQETAGTGYSWEIIDLDRAHLELLGVTTKPLKKGPIAGGPVLKTWRLRALKPGRTELKLYYYRVWEGLDKAAEKFAVRVKIP